MSYSELLVSRAKVKLLIPVLRYSGITCAFLCIIEHCAPTQFVSETIVARRIALLSLHCRVNAWPKRIVSAMFRDGKGRFWNYYPDEKRRRRLVAAALVLCGVREGRRHWLGCVERVVVGHGGSGGSLTVFFWNLFFLPMFSIKHYNT